MRGYVYTPASPRLSQFNPLFDYVDGSWRELAACKGLDNDLFFPAQGGPTKSIQAAKRICWVCPVREECLDYALISHSRWGIWGGMTEKERRKVKRGRRRASA